MKKAIFILILLLSTLSPAYALDEVIFIEPQGNTEFKAYSYQPGYSQGDLVGLRGKYTLTYYGTAQRWLSGDLQGDGRDELVAIALSPTATELKVFVFEEGYKKGENRGLRQIDTLRYYKQEDNWLLGDVNGDGREEIIAVETTSSRKELRVFSFQEGYQRGTTEGLKRLDTLYYNRDFSHIATGEVNGEKKEEVLIMEEATSGVDVGVYTYSPGSQGAGGKLKGLARLHHFKGLDFILGDIDERLEITGYSPEAQVEIGMGTEQSFSAQVEASDPDLVELNWKVNGESQGQGEEFTFAPQEERRYNITLLARDEKISRTLEWVVGVVSSEEGPPPEEEPPEEEEPEKPEMPAENNVTPNQPPRVELLSPGEGEEISGRYRVEWEVSDPEGEKLDTTLEIKGKIFHLTNGKSYLLDTEVFEDGTTKIKVTVSDGESESSSQASVEIDNSKSSGGDSKMLGISPSAILITSALIIISLGIIYFVKTRKLLRKEQEEDLREP